MANILEDTQAYVVGKLSADYQLSGMCTFLVENNKDIDYQIKNALARQGIVAVCMTPRATYAGKFEDLFLAWQLEQLEIDIVENTIVNRGKKNGYMTGQDIAMRVFDVLCPLSGEFEGQFCPVSVEEGEDRGLLVNKCILKALVYGEHGDVPQPEKPITYQFVKLLDQPPPLSVQPRDGWMWDDNGTVYFYSNHVAHPLGGVEWSQMTSYVSSQVSSKADEADVAALSSSLSDLSNSLSSMHGDYIEDAIGNTISANLSGKKVNGEYAWMLQSTSYGAFALTGTYGNASYFPENPDENDVGVELTIQEGSSTEQGYDDFGITTYYWRNVGAGEETQYEWVSDSGGTAGTIPVGGTHFADLDWTADYTWQTQSIEDMTLATQEYVDGLVGDIESILSSNPYACGWQITLLGTSESDSLSAVLYGTLAACTKNRPTVKFSGVLDTTNILSLSRYNGMSFDIFTPGTLSDVYDGHTIPNATTLYFSDAWGYHNNTYPEQQETRFLSVSLAVAR